MPYKIMSPPAVGKRKAARSAATGGEDPPAGPAPRLRAGDRPRQGTQEHDHEHEHGLLLLIERLPGGARHATHWLRRPSSRWLRIPAGLLLVLGGVFSFLPILGLWMLPLGLILLAEDVPALRRLRGRSLKWIAHHRPHWLHGRGQ